MTQTLLAGEIGQLSGEAIREMATRGIAAKPVAEYAYLVPVPWSEFISGEWDQVGVSEDEGGGGADLRDLVEIARVLGETALPTPLLETIWAKRWSPAARDSQAPVSVAVIRPTGRSGSALVPWGADPQTRVLRTVGQAGDELVAPDGAVEEGFAPVLRTAVLPWATQISADASRELAILWAAECVGAAQHLVDLSVDYARVREQFGKPIGSFQAVKHRLADMHSDAEYADTAVIWAAMDSDNAYRAIRYAVETSLKVAQSAIQVHGGMGFTWEMGLHFYLRSMLVRRELVSGLIA